VTDVAIVGVTGYAGRELLRYLVFHPRVQIRFLVSTKKGGAYLREEFPHLPQENLPERLLSLTPRELKNTDVVFLSLPHGETHPWVAELIGGPLLIDLSADFRFRSPEEYKKAYGEHPAPHLLKEGTYGLTEWYRKEIRSSILIANPGCYPTSVLLPLLPLVKNQIVTEGTIVVDSLSGVTGAGRTPKVELLFSEIGENFRAYGIPHHRHTPEMEEKIREWGGSLKIVFTPHLVPSTRGILSTIHIPYHTERIYEAIQKEYEEEPFITVLPPGKLPETGWVRGTNRVYIGVIPREEGWTTLITVMDNLGKGASGQAIQNLNVRMGWEETLSLSAPLPV
jgi:N-acetyl-gamma-glutamyl-phosphate reductase